MRRTMTAIAGTLTFWVDTPAYADRYAVVSTENVIAINLDTIRVVDGMTRAWTVAVLPVQGKKVYFSTLDEYDCKSERSRVLSNKMYAITGEFIVDIPPTEWSFPAPETGAGEVLQYGCGKKVASPDMIVSGRLAEFVKEFED